MHKESIMQPICDRELHEECGVFGVVGVPDAANLTYYGLHSLQHRGQEGCGIVSVSKEGAIQPEDLPGWAKHGLTAIQQEQAKKKTAKERER